jgi:hypothetical protein
MVPFINSFGSFKLRPPSPSFLFLTPIFLPSTLLLITSFFSFTLSLITDSPIRASLLHAFGHPFVSYIDHCFHYNIPLDFLFINQALKIPTFSDFDHIPEDAFIGLLLTNPRMNDQLFNLF